MHSVNVTFRLKNETFHLDSFEKGFNGDRCNDVVLNISLIKFTTVTCYMSPVQVDVVDKNQTQVFLS